MYEQSSNLTIDEAAGVIGISSRRLRVLLERPEYAARTVSEQRTGKTGTRTATTLPPDLVADLVAIRSSSGPPANAEQGTRNTGGTDNGNVDVRATRSPLSKPAPQNRPASVAGPDFAAELLAAKDQIIASEQSARAAAEAQIADLQRRLDEAQLQVNAAMELAHREQSLNMERARAALLLEAQQPDAGKKNRADDGVGPGRVRAMMKAEVISVAR